MHSEPDLGKLAQYAGRLLSMRSHHVAVPWDRDIELQVSPALIVYVEPVHAVGVADAVCDTLPEIDLIAQLGTCFDPEVGSTYPFKVAEGACVVSGWPV